MNYMKNGKQELRDMIQNMDFDGVGSGKGDIYHEIPFDINYQGDIKRQDNFERFDIILNNGVFQNKNILDIGCNIGFFSFKFARQSGCHVVGVDSDFDAIVTAEYIKKCFHVENIDLIHGFFNRKIVNNLIKKYDFDIIILNSVIHWLMDYYHDLDKIVNLVRCLNNTVQVLFYEPSSSHSGFYPELLSHKNIKNFLHSCGFSKVELLGKLDREIWKAQVDYNKIKHSDNVFWIKKIKLSDARLFLYMNECYFSQLLRDKNITSFFYRYINRDGFRWFFYERLNGFKSLNQLHNLNIDQIQILERNLFDILKEFKKLGLVHRDIIPRNIMVNPETMEVRIIDLEFMVYISEEIPTGSNQEKEYLNSCLKTLGGRYCKPDRDIFDFDYDKYMVTKIIRNLRINSWYYRVRYWYVEFVDRFKKLVN